MKKLICTLVVLIAAGALIAQAPPELKLWKAADLKAYEPKLTAKMSPQKLAVDTIGALNGEVVLMVHREATGEAEYHERLADFMIVESGSATMLVGGKMKDGKTTTPGEIRAPSIEGGETYKVAVGDVMSIPAKIPHQVVVSKGGKVTYLTLKVAAK
jgi:mannose-6-phosphate isomerase-like protein (cupin superfamily)